MSEAGSRLIQSAQEALEYLEGTADKSKYRVHIPQEVDVKHIRETLSLSQVEFADCYGFSVRTLQQWEQGRSTPRGVAKNFLLLLEREPDIVRKTLFGISEELKDSQSKVPHRD